LNKLEWNDQLAESCVGPNSKLLADNRDLSHQFFRRADPLQGARWLHQNCVSTAVAEKCLRLRRTWDTAPHRADEVTGPPPRQHSASGPTTLLEFRFVERDHELFITQDFAHHAGFLQPNNNFARSVVANFNRGRGNPEDCRLSLCDYRFPSKKSCVLPGTCTQTR